MPYCRKCQGGVHNPMESTVFCILKTFLVLAQKGQQNGSKELQEGRFTRTRLLPWQLLFPRFQICQPGSTPPQSKEQSVFSKHGNWGLNTVWKSPETTSGSLGVNFICLSAKAILWPLKNTVIMKVFGGQPREAWPFKHTPILTTHFMPWHVT